MTGGGPGIAVPVSTDVAEARVVTDDPGDGLPKPLDYWRDAGGLQFKVEVPKTWREGLAFCATQRFWEQDCVVYSLCD